MNNIEKVDEIEELVYATVLKYDSIDPEEIIKANNIEIYDKPFNSVKESLSFQHDNRWIIMINPELSPERFYYRLAHELGHILMHGDACNHLYRHKRKGFDHRILDYEADYFAEELLSYKNVDV